MKNRTYNTVECGINFEANTKCSTHQSKILKQNPMCVCYSHFHKHHQHLHNPQQSSWCRHHEDNCGLFSCLWFVCKCEYHKQIGFTVICSNFCDMSVIFLYWLNFTINFPKGNLRAGKPRINYHTYIGFSVIIFNFNRSYPKLNDRKKKEIFKNADKHRFGV